MDKPFEYGQWVTHKGERRMITHWNESGSMVQLWMGNSKWWVPVSETSDRSDFMNTDAERKALGYEF